MNPLRRRLRLVPALLIACLAGGCSTVEVEPFPEPLRPPKPLPAATTGLEEVPSPAEDARTGPRTTRAPGWSSSAPWRKGSRTAWARTSPASPSA